MANTLKCTCSKRATSTHGNLHPQLPVGRNAWLWIWEPSRVSANAAATDLLMLNAEWFALWSSMTCSLVLPLAPVIITRLLTVRVLCTVRDVTAQHEQDQQQHLLMLMQVMRQQCSVCSWPAAVPRDLNQYSCWIGLPAPLLLHNIHAFMLSQGWGLFLPAVSPPVR